jgi:hypothetical protein
VHPLVASFNVLQQLPRLTQQRVNLLPLCNRVLRVKAVFDRVAILLWRARSSRAAMHSTPLLAVYRRRLARQTGAGSRAAPGARQHRADIP